MMKFMLGSVLMTRGALAYCAENKVDPFPLLVRHCEGDWGDLCDDDKRLNDEAVTDGSRIFSSYKVSEDEKLWIITEACYSGVRRSTTILLPDEY